MCVFVRVNVSDGDAGCLELSDLRDGFALDLFRADAASEERGEEAAQRRTEGAAVWTKKRKDGFRRGDGLAVDEDDVAADAKRGMRASDGDGVVKGGARGHQCGRGESAGGGEFGDGAVDAASEAEVVGVEDQAGAHTILSVDGPKA